MNQQNLRKLLHGCNEDHVNNYVAYLEKLQTEKKKDGNQWINKNPWMKHKTDEYLATIFKAVLSDGLVFDGEDITLQNTGVSYSYQAFKNKMLNTYPESIIDVSLVHTDDIFQFSKDSGHVRYTHRISNPFSNNENSIIGGYCVIKNKRGEFLTILSRQDIDKHRRVAKGDFIWKNWFAEMAMKTVIKKACKQHFKDIYHNIETIDNENYEPENLVSAEEREAQERQEYLNEMKWYAIHEPQAYKEVTEHYQLKTPQSVKKQSSWAGILRAIKDEIKGVEWRTAPPKAVKLTPFLEKMKKFAGVNLVAYNSVLERYKVESARTIQNPEIQNKILKDVEIAINNNPPGVDLADTPEGREWIDIKESFPEIVANLPEPVTPEQCVAAIEQVKRAVNDKNKG